MSQSRFSPIKHVQRALRPSLRRASGNTASDPVFASRPRQSLRSFPYAPGRRRSVKSDAAPSEAFMELVCRVRRMSDLQTAIGNGADCVQFEYGSVEVDAPSLADGICYAHERACKLVLELNAPLDFAGWEVQRAMIDNAVRAGIDAIVFADPAMLLYASANYPALRRYACLPDYISASNTINLFQQSYGVRRVLLPTVMSMPELEQISKATSAELQILGFGHGAAVPDRRCATVGIASMAASASCLGGVLHGISVGACANGEIAANENYFNRRISPDPGVLNLLPRLNALGVRAVLVDTHHDSPAHLACITRVWRNAITACLEDPQHYAVEPAWIAALQSVCVTGPSQILRSS